MPHVEQAVVQVLAVGGERRLAGAQPAEDRETEVEQRHDEDRERQQDRDAERGQQALRSVDRREVDLTGDRDRGRRHEQPDQERARVAHEEPRGMPVERQEAGADPDEHRRDELGEVEVVALLGRPVADDVARR